MIRHEKPLTLSTTELEHKPVYHPCSGTLEIGRVLVVNKRMFTYSSVSDLRIDERSKLVTFTLHDAVEWESEGEISFGIQP